MNTIKSRMLLLLLFCFALLNTAAAQTKLASIFTDNMLLQQKEAVNIWGWDQPGHKVLVTTSWNHKTYSGITSGEGKWTVRINTPAAAKQAYQITVSNGKPLILKNILIGEVWLCTGQSNMEMPLKGFKGQPIMGSNDLILKSANPYIRLYTVPRSSITTEQENSKPSAWKIAGPEAVSNFSATGYIFGKLLQEMLDIPIGLVNVSYSGSSAQAWMSAATLKAFPSIKIPAKEDTIKLASRTPTTLYNGMIHPVTGFNVKGAIFYQGESNYEDPDLYEKLFPALVKEWRTEWKNDFPFYYAQIAPYNYKQLPPNLDGGKYNSAYLREVQRKSVSVIPGSAMAVLMDIGEEKSIHPVNKEAGGKRLALLALANTYGLKGFGAESPAYQSLEISGNSISVKFAHAGNGLTAFGKELTQFEIAGADKVFYPAKAVIKGENVVVSAPEVASPAAVRYAFKDFVLGQLYNTEGLPASSFRTDNW
ncbi:sialate O-acetylesterase [Pedobacter westerhofensis]|uniref:Sialate O-acetylesterase n=1 Tax=Pedobacter westerhofensis TaxID=425512 RepID=A0A521AL98_9SPHI|nr:sialate O-acetylesterase [Pedobacter westerhofensis]SMO35588.1 sialate O-acetylesterase [Pedobacter westerhofensis]